MDDILSGGPTIKEVKQKKATTTEIFKEVGELFTSAN